MTTLRRLLIRLTIVIVIVVIAGTGFGYSQLQVQRSGSLSITPALKAHIGSIGSAMFSVFSGDLGVAAESVIEGVRFKGTVEVANESFVPVFIPKLEHHVFVQRVATSTTFDTPSMFLAPGAGAEFEFDFVVPVEGLGPGCPQHHSRWRRPSPGYRFSTASRLSFRHESSWIRWEHPKRQGPSPRAVGCPLSVGRPCIVGPLPREEARYGQAEDRRFLRSAINHRQ